MQWYFDVISPYAYLQSTRLNELNSHVEIECIPVLFAGLLGHWGHLGPAEIPPKRRWIFENVLWLAQRDGIPLNYPPSHPFNPLPLLRLSELLGNRIDIVQRLFRFVWVDGALPQDEHAFAALLAEFDIEPDGAALRSTSIKQRLRDHCTSAVAHGVFGVPTLIHEGQLFWGYDGTDMALQYVTQSGHWSAQFRRRVEQLADGVHRSR